MKTVQFADIFRSKFGGNPEVISRAPGRVNIIGEHIDYNGGFVLPIAICKEAVVAFRRTSDKIARIYSYETDQTFAGDIAKSRIESPFWVNYFLGVWNEFSKLYKIEGGFDLLISSNVPTGSGLSSSAAIEVATGTAISAASGFCIDSLSMARLCQRAENLFVGVNCGLMDQAASACSKNGNALLLDCSKPSFEHIPFELSGDAAILVAHCGVRRGLSQSEYNTRRNECLEALNIINRVSGKEYKNLCEIPYFIFSESKNKLSDILIKRARHVITEQERVVNTCEALKENDWEKIGEYLNESHESLASDFNVSCNELDEITNLLRKDKDVYGSRLTGAGFGGCSVSIIRRSSSERLLKKLDEEYYNKHQYESLAFVTQARDGANILWQGV